MATGKRYFWIKLKESFMTSDAVDFLMGQPDGANYVVLYQMLCLKTINTDGRMERHIGEVIIPYDVEKIQRDTKWFSVDTIRVALNLYKSLGLVYLDQDGVLSITDHKNLVGSETDWAAKKRRQSEGKNTAQLPPAVGESDGEKIPTDIEIDIRDRDKELEIDKELDKKIDGTNSGSSSDERGSKPTKRFTPPTRAEVEAYCRERNNGVDADRFVDFYTAKGWMVGRNPMKDWKAAVRTWEHEDKPRRGSTGSQRPTARPSNAASAISALQEIYDEEKGGVYD